MSVRYSASEAAALRRYTKQYYHCCYYSCMCM